MILYGKPWVENGHRVVPWTGYHHESLFPLLLAVVFYRANEVLISVRMLNRWFATTCAPPRPQNGVGPNLIRRSDSVCDVEVVVAFEYTYGMYHGNCVDSRNSIAENANEKSIDISTFKASSVLVGGWGCDVWQAGWTGRWQATSISSFVAQAT